VKFATGDARLTGSFRVDGLTRALGGFIAGTFTTTQRNAIGVGVGLGPYGTVILNSTTNRYEWNKGDDTTRDWQPIGLDPVVAVVSTGSKTNGFTYTITAPVAGTYILEWGCGDSTPNNTGETQNISNNKTAGVSRTLLGMPALRTGVSCTAGEVITFTCNCQGTGVIIDPWAKLTRTA